MKAKKTAFKSVDEYIAAFPSGTQKVLEEVRETIQAAAPNAREKISYQIAAFELNGKGLIYFAGWKHHISIYPIPAGDEAFTTELSQYMGGKGTLKFALDKPLPRDLIEKIVKLRIAENQNNNKLKASIISIGDNK